MKGVVINMLKKIYTELVLIIDSILDLEFEVPEVVSPDEEEG